VSWQTILIVQAFLVLFIPFLLRELGCIYGVQFYKIPLFLFPVPLSFPEAIRSFFFQGSFIKTVVDLDSILYYVLEIVGFVYSC
jgi:hypothetical protein